MSSPAPPATVVVQAIAGDAARCEAILRQLPDWFGIESALVQYAADVDRFPTWLATGADCRSATGFITVRRHFPESAEIHCLAVVSQRHRKGSGRLLVAHVEELLRRDGAKLLQVKTMGPSKPNAAYAQTLRFYRAMGFVPVEEFCTLWPGLPCLQLVKNIAQ